MRLRRHTKFREERFGGVLFETSSERVFALNASAAAILRAISASDLDEAALIGRLEVEFDAPPGTIGTEIRAFLAELADRALIEV